MDYKKKYKEALELMKDCIPDKDGLVHIRPCEIFPELKENEDERIKEVIINVFDISEPDETWGDTDITTKDIIAWLEKQGEQNNKHLYNVIIALWDLLDKIDTFSDLQIDDTNPDNPFRKIEDITQERYKFVKSDGYNLYIKGEQITDFKQDEQKPTDKVEPKFKVGDTIVEKDLDEYDYETIKDIKDGQYIFTDGYCMNIDEQEGWQLVKIPVIIEQKSAWSEEDEKMWATVSDLLWEGYKLSDKKVSWYNIRYWLLPKIICLKDRVQPQPKQEWSEEEKARIDKIIDVLDWAEEKGHIHHSDWEDYVCYVKSLKPQNTWKPSDGQMKALEKVRVILHNPSIWDESNPILYQYEELMRDLIKLREE